MEADELMVRSKDETDTGYLKEYEMKHETLRALLEIRDCLKNINVNLFNIWKDC